MNPARLRGVALCLLLGCALPLGAAPSARVEKLAATDTAPDAASSPVWRYTVRPGDTLINVGERYLAQPGQWAAIQQLNQVADPYRLLPGTVLRIPAALLRRSPTAALLETASGPLRWRSGRADWQPAAAGQRFTAGSTLETLDEASALLRFADASTLLLAANSQLVFDSLGAFGGGLMVDTRLRLQRGEGEILANPAKSANRQLQIDTPSAQAVVRGTDFRLAVDGDSTREETLAGLVGVSGAARSVNVARGRGTLVRAGSAPIKPVALLAAADVSGFPARFEVLPLRFALPQMPGAEAWHGQIGPAAAFDRILASKLVRGAAPGAPLGLSFADLPNGDYVLRLSAVDANGLRGLPASHPFTVFARPFAPGINSPGDAATIRSARPLFAWSEVHQVASYRVQVALKPDFAEPLHESISDASQWPAPADLPAGKLHWRAASIDAAGQQGPWSAAAAFTYLPGPGPVDLGRAAIEFDSQTIRLKLPQPPAGLSYEAVVAAGPELEPELAKAQADGGELELTRPDGGTYYLGVRLVDRSDNTGGPQVVQKIEVPYSRWWLLLLLLPLPLAF